MPALSKPVKSAERAVTVLELLADSGPISFADIVKELGIPRSSASGLLNTLEKAGWIERDVQRRYLVGVRAWQVGGAYRGHDDITARVAPRMNALAAQVNETVQLAQLDGTENVYIAISPGRNPMRLVSSVGMRLPSHATGIGKALLVQLDRSECIRRYEGRTLDIFTERTIRDVDSLMACIADVERRGYATDDEEYVEGCQCIAMPLWTAGLGIITALSITVPSFRVGAEWPKFHLAALTAATEDIQRMLGLDKSGPRWGSRIALSKEEG